MTGEIKTYKHSVKVPKSLKEHKDAVASGLMYLALGHADIATRASDDDELVTVEFRISEQAELFLKELLKSHTKREVFKSALAWVSRRPSYVQNSTL
jgi:hypothetical protein